MLKFILRRLLLLIPILIGLSFLLFVWVRALPGGPATALLGERATPERVAQVNAAYGFDKPVLEQYVKYLGRVARLEFGQSITLRKDITDELFRRFPATIELADGRDDLRHLRRCPARLRGRQARALLGRQHRRHRLAGRRVDPRLLPRADPEVDLRAATRLVPDHRPARPHP